jgi:hypothetical protein
MRPTSLAWLSRAALAAVPLLVALPEVAAADPLPAHAQELVDYDIAVRLDPDAKVLVGQERLTWRNPSTDTVGELWFHLYLNGFRNSESTFYRETGGQLRRDGAKADDWGSIDVTRMALADGTDLLPSQRFEHPDDDNANDRTVFRVTLPAPVAPGAEVTLDVDFRAQLPEVYARTGHHNDFFAVGQWFPKLGVYESAGMRGRTSGGWNCHQFHGNSEFYADYGHYKVAITVPRDYVVGASGERLERRESTDGTTTYVHEQGDIHDFAWMTSRQLVELHDTFSGERDVPAADYEAAARRLGRSRAEVQLRDVELTLLLQPDHLPQAARHFAAAKLALRTYGLAFGTYPYPTLTVVDPNAGGASGVEYPTLVTGATSFLWQHWPFTGVREAEVTVVHEIGHQFWYGLVGNNEFEEAWLDEGFTTYSTDLAMTAGFGPDSTIASVLGFELGALEAERAVNRLDRRFDQPRSVAWGYSPKQYGFYSYARPALVLQTLAGVVGEETMARILRTYAERWRFRHPRTEDFYAVASEVAGRDLMPFFAQVMERPGVFDPAVVAISSELLRSPRGILERDGRSETITEEQSRAADEAAEKDGKELYRNVVELRQLGELVLPVDVELEFDGAPSERRTWDGEKRWVRWELEQPHRLRAVHIDPDRRLPIDASWLNNARRIEPDQRASTLWSARLLFWAQQALAALGL